MGKILVTGATGNTGSQIVAQLKQTGADVRALVRDESKAASLNDQGVDVVRGDLDDAASLADSLSGVEKIYLCTSNGPTAKQRATSVALSPER